MAELADALDLGSSPHRRIGVRVPSLAPEKTYAGVMSRFILNKVKERNKPALGGIEIPGPLVAGPW